MEKEEFIDSVFESTLGMKGPGAPAHLFDQILKESEAQKKGNGSSFMRLAIAAALFLVMNVGGLWLWIGSEEESSEITQRDSYELIQPINYSY